MRTEDDIREAYESLAMQAPGPTAVLAAVRDGEAARARTGDQAGGGRQRRRLLAPLAAAVAVVAVIAAGVALGGRQPHQGSGSALNQLPRYYMTILLSSDVAGIGGPRIVVKNTRTGATVLEARPPASYRMFAGITGASDDRTFVLAVDPTRFTQGNQDFEKLFLARLDPARRTLTMTPLPIPEFTPSTFLVAIALSPNGTEIAAAMETGRGHNHVVINLYSLDGRILKTWHSPGTLVNSWLNPANMSWTRAGVLAINWTFYARNWRKDRSGLWLLNTGTPGGNLGNQSRLVVPGNTMPGYVPWGDSLVASDGKTIAVPMVSKNGFALGDSGKIQEFSVTSGRPTRALWPVHFGGPDAPPRIPGEALMWSNASGSVLVAQANVVSGRQSDGKTAMGVISGKHFTPIPGAPSTKLLYYGLVF